MNMPARESQKPSDYINQLRAIFYMMVGGPLIFFVVVYFLNRGRHASDFDPEMHTIFMYIVPLFCIFHAIVAYWMYEQRLRKARKQSTLQDKLKEVLQGSIVKFAILEGATLLTLVVYLLTNHILYAGFYIVMLILFAMSNPTVYSVTNDLRLSQNEAERLHRNEAFN
jgi:hypothetical protein